MTTNISDLEKQIDLVLENFIAAAKSSALAALNRRLGSLSPEPALAAAPRLRTVISSTRRSAQEIEQLMTDFYQAVCGHPGETMICLSKTMGVSSSSLTVPIARLKKGDQIRTSGQRQHTRYFPMVVPSGVS